MAAEGNDQEIKFNDSLYQLYAPPTDPMIDIIFFHGLQVNLPMVGSTYGQAYTDSWTSTSSSDPVCWPQKWLGPDLCHARIFSVSYDSSAFKTSTEGTQDFYLIAERMVEDIVFSSDRTGQVGLGQGCPVLLVGHSLGGLVLKVFLLAAQKEMDRFRHDAAWITRFEIVERFLNNVRGVFYYSTPHSGSRLADLMKVWPGAKSPIVKNLKVLNTDSARLNNDFRVWRSRANVKAWTMFELKQTSFHRLHATIVEEGSARYDSDSCMSVAADHFSICKPASREDSQYYWLVACIRTILPLRKA